MRTIDENIENILKKKKKIEKYDTRSIDFKRI